MIVCHNLRSQKLFVSHKIARQLLFCYWGMIIYY